jgi:hypothetical protein
MPAGLAGGRALRACGLMLVAVLLDSLKRAPRRYPE